MDRLILSMEPVFKALSGQESSKGQHISETIFHDLVRLERDPSKAPALLSQGDLGLE